MGQEDSLQHIDFFAKGSEMTDVRKETDSWRWIVNIGQQACEADRLIIAPAAEYCVQPTPYGHRWTLQKETRDE